MCIPLSRIFSSSFRREQEKGRRKLFPGACRAPECFSWFNGISVSFLSSGLYFVWFGSEDRGFFPSPSFFCQEVALVVVWVSDRSEVCKGEMFPQLRSTPSLPKDENSWSFQPGFAVDWGCDFLSGFICIVWYKTGKDSDCQAS